MSDTDDIGFDPSAPDGQIAEEDALSQLGTAASIRLHSSRRYPRRKRRTIWRLLLMVLIILVSVDVFFRLRSPLSLNQQPETTNSVAASQPSASPSNMHQNAEVAVADAEPRVLKTATHRSTSPDELAPAPLPTEADKQKPHDATILAVDSHTTPQADDLQAAVAKAQGNVDQATTEADSAASALDAARAACLSRLHDSNGYKAAVSKTDESKKKLDAARAGSDIQARLDAGSEYNQLRVVPPALEKSALASDKAIARAESVHDSDVLKLADATAILNQLKEQQAQIIAQQAAARVVEQKERDFDAVELKSEITRKWKSFEIIMDSEIGDERGQMMVMTANAMQSNENALLRIGPIHIGDYTDASGAKLSQQELDQRLGNTASKFSSNAYQRWQEVNQLAITYREWVAKLPTAKAIMELKGKHFADAQPLLHTKITSVAFHFSARGDTFTTYGLDSPKCDVRFTVRDKDQVITDVSVSEK